MDTPADYAVALIEQHGVGGLGGYDGCPCTQFQVFNVNVEISCHKSGDGPRIYVSSAHMDYGRGALEKVAAAVVVAFEAEWDRRYDVVLNSETYEGAAAFNERPTPTPPAR